MAAYSSKVATAALALALALAGCSQGSQSQLPDLATASPSKQQTMSPADQKKAIDAMIAKRDAQQAEAGQTPAK